MADDPVVGLIDLQLTDGVGHDKTAGRRSSSSIEIAVFRASDCATSQFARVTIVTLAESRSVNADNCLQADLHRAGTEPRGWLINSSFT
jgi:hypothetical protein